LVGNAGKFCKAEFYKIAHGKDAYPHVISKADKKRCHRLNRPAIVQSDRTHSWDDDGIHRVALNSDGLDSWHGHSEKIL
jgi:hypothetical protein